jgi:methylated-DNA-[protein]-cysteine S-methyltransferase
MKLNPKPYTWPCHRVVMSDGSLGGYAFGKEKKIELLRQEGVSIANSKVVNFKDKLFIF